MEWYISVLKSYAVFEGRARRKEFWMFSLFNVIFSIGLSLCDYVLGTSLLGFVYAVVVFIPSLAVCVRRLHDTNRSGWWVFIAIIPVIGSIALIIFASLEGDVSENNYGPNPKYFNEGEAPV
ncbi:membrane protein [Pseudoalteromonas luteoviolacea]|uniref:Membrane protein n=1 Tax=Pseudoalteromonas luteoviolacea TaxID=43657 RepID=A0A0C1Q6J4_9GAMM|nr:DUF805 domain-containing protein [Pseudoalteromonas luteoviolacea]KID56271.1 membrane protein [Pseudoalteromonas luteoviolacea]